MKCKLKTNNDVKNNSLNLRKFVSIRVRSSKIFFGTYTFEMLYKLYIFKTFK